MTPDENQGASAGSHAWIVLQYTITLLVLGVFAGFLVGVFRRVAPGVLAEHVWGRLDLGAVVNLLGTVLICLFVYWRLATKHPLKYFRLGLAASIFTGLGNFMFSAALAPPGIPRFQLWPIAMSLGFHIFMMLMAGFAFGPLRRTSEVA